jgi:1,4-alpha-glucan branching enzyme
LKPQPAPGKKAVSKGSFAFVLHSHLPYVLSHGRWPHGTDWLCEAAAETYLPIIKILRELQAEGKQPRLTIGLSPVLCEQLSDSSFKEEFISYLNTKIKAAQDDIDEFTRFGQHNMGDTAKFWEKWYRSILYQFNDLKQDIVEEFRILQSDGIVEIITCGATHGYYPLLSRDESLQVQTKAAVKNYEKHFGQKPKGIWLPECAYRPAYSWAPPVPINGSQKARMRKGADEFLSENGIEFFIVDSAMLKGGKAIGAYLDRFEGLQLLFDQYQKGVGERPEEQDKTPR